MRKSGIRSLIRSVLPRRGHGADGKGDHEIAFWRDRLATEGELRGPHYPNVFMTQFGLEPEFFIGRAVLDIGCGPRGSLEWFASDCRIGLDPLAVRYRELGTERHAMRYVAAGAEAIPFRTGTFDIVTSMNSLDHVDELESTIAEMVRVLRPGGTMLVETHVGHEPSPTEPVAFGFEVLDLFGPQMRVVDRSEYEMRHAHVHASSLAAVPYDHADPARRSGILKVRLEKVAD